MFKEMFCKNYSQAKADVLRSSKRQSFESPMMGSLKLSPSGLASTQARLISQLQLRTFIPSAGLCQRTGGTDSALNAQSPPHPPVWRDKGKRFKAQATDQF